MYMYSMISLNKRIESLSQKVSTLSYKDDMNSGGGSEDHQEDLKNIQNNMQAIMNAVKVGYIGDNAESVEEIYCRDPALSRGILKTVLK